MRDPSLEGAIGAILRIPFDVALVDVGPECKRFQTCKRFRAADAHFGLILLGEKENGDTRLRAFEAGADYYIQKGRPLVEELSRSICAALARAKERRRASRSRQWIVIDRARIDADSGAVLIDGQRQPLRERQSRLLVCLAAAHESFVPHAELCRAAGIPERRGYRNLHVEMSRLLRSFPALAPYIQSLRGMGYRLFQPADQKCLKAKSGPQAQPNGYASSPGPFER